MRLIFRFINFFTVIILLLGVFIACLPTILSTNWGKNQVVYFVNKKIDGKIELKKLQLSWFENQVVEGFSLTDPAGLPIVYFDILTTEATLWQALQKSITLGKTTLKNLNASIIIDKDGVSNLQKAIGSVIQTEMLPPSTISLANVNAELVFDPNHQPLIARLSGISKQNNLMGSFDINVLLNQFTASNWGEVSKQTEKLLTIEGSKDAQIHIDIQNFPVDIIDQMVVLKNPKMSGFLHHLIGNELNLTADKEKSNQGLAFNFLVSSPKLKGDLKGKIENGIMLLNQPSEFNLKVDKESLTQLLDGDTELQQDTNLRLVLEDFALPLRFLEGETVHSCDLNLKAHLSLTPTQINGINILSLRGDVSSEKCDDALKITLAAKTEKENKPYDLFLSLQSLKPKRVQDLEKLKEMEWTGGLIATSSAGTIQLSDLHIDFSNPYKELSAVLTLLKQDGSFNPLLPDPIPFTFSTTESLSNFKINLSGTTLNGAIDAGLENHVLTVNQPATIHYSLSSEGFKEVGKLLEKDLPNLLNTASINLQIDPEKVQLKEFIENLELKGIVNIDKFVFRDKTETTITVENILLPWAINNQLALMTLKMNGDAYTSLNDKKSRLALRFAAENLFNKGELNLKQTKFEIISELFGLPTTLVSNLIASTDLSPLIGPIIDLELKTAVDMTSKSEGYWDMYIDSTNLSAKARIQMGDSITLYKSNKPTAQIRLTVTPEGFQFIKRLTDKTKVDSPLLLAKPVTLTAYLDELDIPLNSTQTWADHAKIDGTFETTEISWKKSTTLQPFSLNGKVSTSDIANHIDFSLNGTSSTSSISVKGVLTHLINALGKIQKIEQLALKANIEAKKLPLSWFQTLLVINETTQKQIEAVLGDPIDATASIHLDRLNGPVKVNLSGDNGIAKLDGKITNGLLTLNSPFQWSIKVTPQLGKDLLQSNMPLLSNILSSEKPILIEIDPAHFSCPLIPFDLNKLSVGKGTIDLGKVMVKNEGDIRNVLSIIRPIPENQFVLWFTPLYFKLDKGLLNLSRLDLLVANMYTLASWGTVDLNSHKMDLVIGLSAQSLRYAFNIQGLSEDYILQIPIKGRNGKVDIDKGKATARITALLAQSHTNSNIKLLGNLVDVALSDGRAPKPTTVPFPWANQFVDNSPKETPNPSAQDDAAEQDPAAKKKKKKIDTNELLQKGASTLMDKFLK